MKSLNFFKSLADSTRIRIYNILLNHELSVNELVQLIGTGQSGISRHLKILTDSGLLNCRRSGVWAFYSADHSRANKKFTESVQLLFDEESALSQDLLLAQKVITDRGEKTRQFFNTIAHKWDLLKLEIMGDFNLNSVIVDNIETGAEVADLGCGTGELLSKIAKHTKTIIGVDSSPKMLDESRKRFSDKDMVVDLRLGELEHLPLKDAETETAIISLALHHLSEPRLAISEAKRILKPGGTLIVAEFEKHDNEALQKKYGDRWPGFEQKEVSSWLGDNNFITSSVKEYKVQQSLKIVVYKSIKRIQVES